MVDLSLLQPIKSEADVKAEAARQDAIIYLRSTDWYVIRQIETGKEIPAEITAERKAARDRLAL